MGLDERIAVLNAIAPANDAQCQEHGALLMLRDARDDGWLIECLNDGFVHLVDTMGDDKSICRAASVSYRKPASDDRALIRYMMAHGHTSPFEMCETIWHVRVPMDTWRQWIRHRTASVNETSTRYSVAIDSAQVTKGWRLQSKTNKQGSCDYVTEWPEDWSTDLDYYSGMNVARKPGDLLGVFWDGRQSATPSAYLSAREAQLQTLARDVYEERLAFGVAKEQARKDLPLATYTEAYWKMDLHNLLHFLELRMDQHAQQEIREYAHAIARIVKEIFPITWEAFEDYRIDGMKLSMMEVQRIRALIDPEWDSEMKPMTDREVNEFRLKARRLGLPAFSTSEGTIS